MSRKIKEYENLIGLLLGPVRERPAMYLGEARLTMMPNFITGYEMGYQMTKSDNSSTEHYFESPGFLNWYFEKNTIGRLTNTWMNPFWDEANGDDFEALMIYFKHLEEYANFLKHK